MSTEVCEYVSDGDLDDLGEERLSQVTYVSDSEKTTRKKKTSSKPPPSPRSPYLSSANLNPRKSSTQRAPRDVWLASLKNGHARTEYDATQMRISMATSTPEYLREALGMRKPKHSRSPSNGYAPGTPEYKDKEDMYDDIMDLKKTLQVQRADSDKLRAKLRRLEEENVRKERQIEQLLDPTKGSEYTRSLVERKAEGSMVVNGLKQKILKLEQRCREKENALSKLQSDLKTTNMEEMKIAVETYYEEVQRLRMLLEAMEKSNVVESKDSRRQLRALRVTVQKLSTNVKDLEEENQRLRQEVEQEMVTVMDSPANRVKGYMDWSKQRLVRRILELEKRLEQLKTRQTAKESNSQKSQESNQVISTATELKEGERGISVATETEPWEVTDDNLQQECVRLKGVVKRLREERRELQERLTNRDEELRTLMAERDDVTSKAENERQEQTSAHERELQRQREEVEELTRKICVLEEKLEEERRNRPEQEQSQAVEKPASPPPPSSLSSSSPGQEESLEQTDRNRAAKVIQTRWHLHRTQDVVLLQSAFRAHLVRQRQQDSQSEPSSVSMGSQSGVSGSGENADGLLEEEVTLLQSVFRAHLRRLTRNSSQADLSPTAIAADLTQPSLTQPPPVAPPTGTDMEEIEEDIAVDNKEEHDVAQDYISHDTSANTRPTSPTSGELELHNPLQTDASKAADSDDSDDIIVSPSRPLRKRESYLSA